MKYFSRTPCIDVRRLKYLLDLLYYKAVYPCLGVTIRTDPHSVLIIPKHNLQVL